MLNQLTSLKIYCKQKKENSLFCIYDALGVKILTRLRIQFRHLHGLKFRRGFSDTISLLCTCGTEFETTEHFLLCCQFYSTQRLQLFENREEVEPNFLSLSAKFLFYCMVLKPIILKLLIKKFWKRWYPTLKQLLVLIDH